MRVLGKVVLVESRHKGVASVLDQEAFSLVVKRPQQPKPHCLVVERLPYLGGTELRQGPSKVGASESDQTGHDFHAMSVVAVGGTVEVYDRVGGETVHDVADDLKQRGNVDVLPLARRLLF